MAIYKDTKRCVPLLNDGKPLSVYVDGKKIAGYRSVSGHLDDGTEALPDTYNDLLRFQLHGLPIPQELVGTGTYNEPVILIDRTAWIEVDGVRKGFANLHPADTLIENGTIIRYHKEIYWSDLEGYSCPYIRNYPIPDNYPIFRVENMRYDRLCYSPMFKQVWSARDFFEAEYNCFFVERAPRDENLAFVFFRDPSIEVEYPYMPYVMRQKFDALTTPMFIYERNVSEREITEPVALETHFGGSTLSTNSSVTFTYHKIDDRL